MTLPILSLLSVEGEKTNIMKKNNCFKNYGLGSQLNTMGSGVWQNKCLIGPLEDAMTQKDVFWYRKSEEKKRYRLPTKVLWLLFQCSFKMMLRISWRKRESQNSCSGGRDLCLFLTVRLVMSRLREQKRLHGLWLPKIWERNIAQPVETGRQSQCWQKVAIGAWRIDDGWAVTGQSRNSSVRELRVKCQKQECSTIFHALLDKCVKQ